VSSDAFSWSIARFREMKRIDCQFEWITIDFVIDAWYLMVHSEKFASSLLDVRLIACSSCHCRIHIHARDAVARMDIMYKPVP
jgi:hypothetical protein